MASTFLLLYIALYDFKFHRIPNLLLVPLVISGISYRKDLSVAYFLFSTFLILVFTKISRCGFGDTKLAIIIINLLVSNLQIAEYLQYVTLITACLILIHLLQNRTMRGDIPFGPALCGAVLVINI
jgi:Flp pilus assembly protein protease CpaA